MPYGAWRAFPMEPFGQELKKQELVKACSSLLMERGKTFIGPGIDGRQLSVSALLAGSSEELWIGTTDKGLYRLLPGRLDHIDTYNGLTGRHILSILQDREGDLWVVTPMGR